MATSPQPNCKMWTRTSTFILQDTNPDDHALKRARYENPSEEKLDPQKLSRMLYVGTDFPRFSSDEKEKIAVYVKTMLGGMPSEADLRMKKVWELKEMLRCRHHKKYVQTGRKEDLINRLQAFLNSQDEVVHKECVICDLLWAKIDMYGDDCGGETPRKCAEWSIGSHIYLSTGCQNISK
jgi:hypothetical protein